MTSKTKIKILPEEIYKEVLRSMVVPCADIVLRNSEEEFLLLKRKREPLKGKWWIIGGRMHKGESIENCALRQLREEAGIRSVKNLFPMGYYEEYFEIGPFEDTGGVHTISFVFLADIGNTNPDVKLDKQSSEWKWSKRLPKHFLSSFKDMNPWNKILK